MNKKYFLGSLLVLALTVTGCQNNNPGDNSDNSNSESSIIQPSKDPGEITGGTFKFDDNQLNTAQEIHTANQLKYLNLQKEYYSMTKSDLDNCDAKGNKNVSTPEQTELSWEFTAPEGYEVKNFTLVFSQNMDLSNPYTVQGTKNPSIKFYNSFLGTNYFKIVANFTSGDTQSSDVKAFKVTEQAPRNLYVGNMPNCRDMGGRTTYAGGKIKQGLIYRGGEINSKTGWYGSQRYTDDTGNTQARDGHIVSQTDASKKAFREDMGMINGLEIDLRSGGETNGYPSSSGKCNFAENGDISYKMLSISSYANGMKNNTAQIKSLFEAFAQADQHPVYYHCYGGADRTGVVGFMLGAVLGMSYTDLVIDFELTSYSSNPSRNYRSHLRKGPWNEWPGMVDYLKNTLG
jgi:hypothetical protein